MQYSTLVKELETLGLRERKARETRRALEVATLDLALEFGYESVTVEQIAQRADVSPRTFFNYFSSKEDAVLGLSTDLAADALLASFPQHPSGAGTYLDLRGFLLEHFEGHVLSDDLLEKRMKVMASVPALLRRRVSTMTALLEKLTHLTARLMATEEALSTGGLSDSAENTTPHPNTQVGVEPTPAHLAEAHMLLLISGAALNHAFRSFKASGAEDDPPEVLRAAFELLESTIAGHLLPVIKRSPAR